MTIKKQEFYEGAALHVLAQAGSIREIRYETPQFVVNNKMLLHLKYSTKKRSPWGFTFMPEEQLLLADRSGDGSIIMGLICGSDGIAALRYEDFLTIASARPTSLHISCYRSHGEHYEINGPDGSLPRKTPPSLWRRILDDK